MARGLEAKHEKLERGSGDMNAPPFYILWVQAGADRDAALAALRASGKIGADVPAYIEPLFLKLLRDLVFLLILLNYLLFLFLVSHR